MSTLTPAQRATPSWLPPAPAGWNEEAVKRRFAIQLGKMLQNDSTGPLDRRVPYLKAQHVQWERVITDDVETMWADPRELRRFGIRHGDLLVCEGGEVGRAAIVRNPPASCIIQNALHRVRVQRDGDARFLLYVLGTAAQQGWFSVLCNKATIAHFTSEKFGNLRAYFPPAAQQTAIADYLDRETGRLDGLIAKHERLLELLAEKRQSLISHAVTRGLAPSAPRKPSGLPWLGDIPAHWDIVCLRRLLRRIEQGVSPQADGGLAEGDSWGVLKAGCVNGGIFDETEHKKLPADFPIDRTIIVHPGDLIVNRASGSPDLVGSMARVPGRLSYRLILCDKTFRLIPNDQSDLQFIAYFGSSSAYRKQIRDVTSGSEGLANNVPVSALKDVLIPRPPLVEQRAIAAHLDAKLAAMAKLRAKVEAAIALLRERRTALIAAAVTGRLPVTA